MTAVGNSQPAVPAPGPLRSDRLGPVGPLLALGNFAWAMPSAAAGTLLQALLAAHSETTKVADYALVSSIGAATAMVVTVTAGALSDRTRSRWGRRSPWMVGGALLAGIGLFGVGSTSAVWALVVCFAVYQGGLSTMLAAFQAVLPDRVAPASLGKAASLSGLGYLIGTALGGFVAAAFVTTPYVGLRIVPWTMLLAMLAFVLLAPDRDSRNLEVPRTSLGVMLREFLPPADRDFWLAFTGRFLVIFAMFVVAGYQLFIATDLLGLATAEAGEVLAVGSLLLAICAGISTVVAGAWSDRLGVRKPFVVAATLLIAFGSVWFIAQPSVMALRGFFVVAGIGYGIYLSVDQALMVEVLPSTGDEAKELGFLSLGNTAPIVLAPIAGGAVVTAVGYQPLFIISAVSAVAGAAAILAIRRVR